MARKRRAGEILFFPVGQWQENSKQRVLSYQAIAFTFVLYWEKRLKKQKTIVEVLRFVFWDIERDLGGYIRSLWGIQSRNLKQFWGGMSFQFTKKGFLLVFLFCLLFPCSENYSCYSIIWYNFLYYFCSGEDAYKLCFHRWSETILWLTYFWFENLPIN